MSTLTTTLPNGRAIATPISASHPARDARRHRETVLAALADLRRPVPRWHPLASPQSSPLVTRVRGTVVVTFPEDLATGGPDALPALHRARVRGMARHADTTPGIVVRERLATRRVSRSIGDPAMADDGLSTVTPRRRPYPSGKDRARAKLARCEYELARHTGRTGTLRTWYPPVPDRVIRDASGRPERDASGFVRMRPFDPRPVAGLQSRTFAVRPPGRRLPYGCGAHRLGDSYLAGYCAERATVPPSVMVVPGLPGSYPGPIGALFRAIARHRAVLYGPTHTRRPRTDRTRALERERARAYRARKREDVAADRTAAAVDALTRMMARAERERATESTTTLHGED